MSSLLFENNDHSFDLSILHPRKSKPPSPEIEIYQLWSEFISKSTYSKYYVPSQRKFNSSLNTSKANTSSPSASTTSTPIIDKLTSFMHKHGIKILPDFTLGTITSYNNSVLSETKLWIMYIIITLRAISSNDQYERYQKIFELFECALRNGCDTVEMFEFFLIVIAEIPPEVVKECGKIMPKEFKEVYRREREVLRKVFSEEKFVLISKDYCEKGCLMLLKKANDNEDSEEKFVIVPLKEKFMYNDKKVVDELLKRLDESEYKNYEYMPYNSNIYYDNK